MGTWACIAVIASVVFLLVAWASSALRQHWRHRAQVHHPIAPERYEQALREAHEDKIRREKARGERERGQ
jgi:hypothetical protein